ncbi:MAG: hypothetical protein KUG72_06155 [Pseudomonadales bacterium]|nr:hypothetical protein [Pseudomonadales bacterium]
MKIKSETVIAIASTSIAAIALAVGLWGGFQTREHNELSVQPLLVASFSYGATNEESGILIENVGLGPAIIISAEIKVNNSVMPDLGYGGVKTAVSNLGIDHDWVVISGLKKNMVIPAGQVVPFIAVSKDEYELNINELLKIRDKVEFSIEYKSMYENNFITSYGGN